MKVAWCAMVFRHDSNPRPINRKSDALLIAPPRHLITSPSHIMAHKHCSNIPITTCISTARMCVKNDDIHIDNDDNEADKLPTKHKIYSNLCVK